MVCTRKITKGEKPRRASRSARRLPEKGERATLSCRPNSRQTRLRNSSSEESRWNRTMKTSRFLATIPRRLSCISKNKLWNQRFFVTSIKVIPFVRRVRCYPIRIVDLPFRTIWRTKDSIEYFFFFFLSFSNVEKTKMKSSHRCNMFSPSACNRFAFKVDKLETIPRLGPNFDRHFCELHDRCFFFRS